MRLELPIPQGLPIAFGHARMCACRNVSGTRVVGRGKLAQVAGLSFKGYGSHCDDYGAEYLTAACALGTARADVDEFVKRLDKCLDEFDAKHAGAGKGAKR